jgi:hypothetical protein
MSLTIGSNFGAYPQALTPAQAAPSGGAAVPGNSSPGDIQGGRGQVVDQINITSITININQAAPASSGSQLHLEVDRDVPLGNGVSALQPLGEGYFSSPTNFVPTGGGGVGEGSSSAAASEASLTLQILSETTNASAGAKSQPSSKADPAIAANVPSDNSTYVSVDISI